MLLRHFGVFERAVGGFSTAHCCCPSQLAAAVGGQRACASALLALHGLQGHVALVQLLAGWQKGYGSPELQPSKKRARKQLHAHYSQQHALQSSAGQFYCCCCCCCPSSFWVLQHSDRSSIPASAVYTRDPSMPQWFVLTVMCVQEHATGVLQRSRKLHPQYNTVQVLPPSSTVCTVAFKGYLHHLPGLQDNQRQGGCH